MGGGVLPQDAVRSRLLPGCLCMPSAAFYGAPARHCAIVDQGLCRTCGSMLHRAKGLHTCSASYALPPCTHHLQQLKPPPSLQLYYWDYTQRAEPWAALRLRRTQQAEPALPGRPPGRWRPAQQAAAAAGPSSTSTALLSRSAPSAAPSLLAGPSHHQQQQLASSVDSEAPLAQYARSTQLPDLAGLPQRQPAAGQPQLQQSRSGRSSAQASLPYLIKSKKSFRAVLTDPVGRGLLYTAGRGPPGCWLGVALGSCAGVVPQHVCGCADHVPYARRQVRLPGPADVACLQ